MGCEEGGGEQSGLIPPSPLFHSPPTTTPWLYNLILTLFHMSLTSSSCTHVSFTSRHTSFHSSSFFASSSFPLPYFSISFISFFLMGGVSFLLPLTSLLLSHIYSLSPPPPFSLSFFFHSSVHSFIYATLLTSFHYSSLLCTLFPLQPPFHSSLLSTSSFRSFILSFLPFFSFFPCLFPIRFVFPLLFPS